MLEGAQAGGQLDLPVVAQLNSAVAATPIARCTSSTVASTIASADSSSARRAPSELVSPTC